MRKRSLSIKTITAKVILNSPQGLLLMINASFLMFKIYKFYILYYNEIFVSYTDALLCGGLFFFKQHLRNRHIEYYIVIIVMVGKDGDQPKKH